MKVQLLCIGKTDMNFVEDANAIYLKRLKHYLNCELVVIPSHKFEKLMNSLPSWYVALINTLLERLRKANARIKV